MDGSGRGMDALGRVCVTGGAGMIGRRLVARLNDIGIAVAVLDDLRSGLTMPSAAVLAIRGDVRDAEACRSAIQTFGAEAVVHLAALHHIPTCERDRELCLDVNVVGTERVLAAAAAAGTGRIVLASSGSVYAASDEALFEDLSPTEPRDNYGLSKLTNEHQLRLWCGHSGRIGRVARIFNTLAGDDPNAHLVPDVLEQLLAEGQSTRIVRLGNLTPRRDYLHGDECAAGLEALLLDDRPLPFDVLNLASGQEHSVSTVVEELAASLGLDVRIEIDPARRRRIDRESQLGSPAKMRQVLGWHTHLTLRDVIKRVLAERERLAPAGPESLREAYPPSG